MPNPLGVVTGVPSSAPSVRVSTKFWAVGSGKLLASLQATAKATARGQDTRVKRRRMLGMEGEG